MGRAQCHTSLEFSSFVWDAVPTLPVAMSPLSWGMLALDSSDGLCSSWVGFLGWILVFWEGWCSTSQGHGGIVLAEPSRSLLISESTELRVKRWISCLSLGKNKLWVSAQDRGAASWQWIPPSYRGCIDPLPFGKCCAQAGGVAFVWSFSWGSYCSCAEVCSPTDAGDSWFAFVRGIKLFSRLTTASALRNFIL